ncbi:MAG TPA: glycosyltransferase, partial [Candidatus Woesebacteria bacterium]|nr:glycosyltransferase [Candidatus Woesebacteria bacterium]
MRVLYLYMFPLWGNGSGAWLRRLIQQTQLKYPTSFEAAVLAPDNRKLPNVKMFPIDPPHKGVFVGNPELPNEKKYADFTSYELIESAKAVEKFKPHIIHAFHTAFLPHVARNLANFYKVPFIITTHGSDLYYFKEDDRWSSLMHSASQKATFITANSDFTKDWYVKMFGKEFYRKTKVLPAGIDNNVDFTRDVSWIDKKYKFKHKKMVLFTGRLTEHKGVEYLIMAAKKIDAEIVI